MQQFTAETANALMVALTQHQTTMSDAER